MTTYALDGISGSHVSRFFSGNGYGSTKKSTTAKKGEKTCVKKLENDHGCIVLSAKGPNNPQKISPVVVIDTVNTYFNRYKTRKRFSLWD